MTIPDAAQKVPMMFRAQIDGRCQLQYAKSGDAVRWASEWVERAEAKMPEFGAGVECRDYRLTWRFVTNGGQDDGVIRPVIGARGIPFYPGSSMKGAFRQACDRALQQGEISAEKISEYCGDNRNLSPGILRFHGGYPTSAEWTKNLVDIVHPQQEWQVKTHNQSSRDRPRGESAYTQISLYQPELRFGISSTKKLELNEWDVIWKIWERALSSGLGCRVCAGYGQPQTHHENVLCQMSLRGQGLASQLLDRTPEFRPNVFRAGLRGHALRIFGGLMDANQAEAIVETLFGGISRGSAQVGLLAIAFSATNPPVLTAETYDVTGELSWLLTRSIAAEQELLLKKLVKQLMQFAMLLGGFGKAWRRASHARFLPDYDRFPIGCHWSWEGRSRLQDNRVRQLPQVTQLIADLRQTAIEWMTLQGFSAAPAANWRESWHPANVQVWGRVADSADESVAIEWLHGSYWLDYDRTGRPIPLSIKRTSVTGGDINRSLNIGRLWHRMYPVSLTKPSPTNPKAKVVVPTPRYLELLTLFPDRSKEFDRFVQYLTEEQDEFKLLWGEP